MTWLLKRLGVSIVLVWAVATIVFFAIYLVPGDPAEMLLSQGGAAPDPALVESVREQLGLNKPILQQYVDNLLRLLRGDLGVSLQDEAPIAGEIARRLPRTLELIGAAALFSIVIGIPAGTLAAMRRGGAFDRIASAIAALVLSVPVFVVGTLAILLFAQYLRVVPAGGFVPFSQNPAQHLLLLSMPSFSIGIGLAGMVFRMTRGAVLEVAARDFVRTARAKGLGRLEVMVHHILRNAMMPVVTVLAMQLGALLGGTVLVEYVFNWPGLSGLLVDAVNARDYPAVVGIVLVISVLFVGLNFLVDIVYGLLDPRVRQT
jgi:peptide/nickel transport system permease protein